MYLLHDPVSNVEGVVAEFDRSKLQEAENRGNIFIAVHSNGSREVVKAADVRRPEPMLNGVELAQPEYVDVRMDAVVACFDALANKQGISTLSAKAARKTFAQALAELKALLGGGSDGNA